MLLAKSPTAIRLIFSPRQSYTFPRLLGDADGGGFDFTPKPAFGRDGRRRTSPAVRAPLRSRPRQSRPRVGAPLEKPARLSRWAKVGASKARGVDKPSQLTEIRHKSPPADPLSIYGLTGVGFGISLSLRHSRESGNPDDCRQSSHSKSITNSSQRIPYPFMGLQG